MVHVAHAREGIVNAFQAIPSAKWDGVAESLRSNCGVATIDFLPPDIVELHSQCFATARRGLDAARVDPKGVNMIGPNDDSAHATGYHSAGTDGSSMSRYNSHREGFVFSDGELFNVDLEDDGGNHHTTCITFQEDMQKLFSSMHDAIASNVLGAVVRNLGCSDANWFQNKLGPTDKSSQWHVKRYVCPKRHDDADACHRAKNQCKECHEEREEPDEFEWLPVHTDPSLISIVLHDAPGRGEGAMGLQYQRFPDKLAPSEDDSQHAKQKKIWVDVPWHGHAVATVFVGSVLSYITGNLYPGAKHRVVYRPPTTTCNEEIERVAATLFVRPRADCMLLVPPSPLLLSAGGDPSVRIRTCTFDVWLARVSRNYMKGRRKREPRGRGNETDGIR